jgi:hypothetical protein
MRSVHALLGAMSVSAILVAAGCAVPVEETPDEGVEEEAPAETGSDVTCGELADEAVRISEEQSEQSQGLLLIKVRQPKIVKDKRKSYKLPKGDKEAVILVCRGAGVWSDGESRDVRLKLTIDADGDQFVEFKPIL